MKTYLLSLIIILNISCDNLGESEIDKNRIKEDLKKILKDLEYNYSYLGEKEVKLKCISEYYGEYLERIQTKEESVLMFEYLLDEFYDSHLILNTNIRSSYRLFSPIYTRIQDKKFGIPSKPSWYFH